MHLFTFSDVSIQTVIQSIHLGIDFTAVMSVGSQRCLYVKTLVMVLLHHVEIAQNAFDDFLVQKRWVWGCVRPAWGVVHTRAKRIEAACQRAYLTGQYADLVPFCLAVLEVSLRHGWGLWGERPARGSVGEKTGVESAFGTALACVRHGLVNGDQVSVGHTGVEVTGRIRVQLRAQTQGAERKLWRREMIASHEHVYRIITLRQKVRGERGGRAVGRSTKECWLRPKRHGRASVLLLVRVTMVVLRRPPGFSPGFICLCLALAVSLQRKAGHTRHWYRRATVEFLFEIDSLCFTADTHEQRSHAVLTKATETASERCFTWWYGFCSQSLV